MNKLQQALGDIHASQELKENTKTFLRQKLGRRSPAPVRRLALVCACLAIFVLSVGGYAVYRTPVSYISIDVNPSIELSLNRFDQVVDVAAYNDDGEILTQRLSLTGQSYQSAIEQLLADKTFAAYLTDASHLSFTVVSDRDTQLISGIEHCSGYAQAGAQCYELDSAQVAAAHESHLSCGKYRAYLELSQYDSSLTVEDCRDMTMAELQQRISACGGETFSTNGSGGGGGSDNGACTGQGGQDGHGHNGHGHGVDD